MVWETQTAIRPKFCEQLSSESLLPMPLRDHRRNGSLQFPAGDPELLVGRRDQSWDAFKLQRCGIQWVVRARVAMPVTSFSNPVGDGVLRAINQD